MNPVYRLSRFYTEKILPHISFIRGATRMQLFLNRLSELGVERADGVPESIFDRGGWDNLIILDACRHDYYECVFGNSDYRNTVGSTSAQFLKRTFSERECDDIVYISANPHTHGSKFENLTGKKPEEVFHSVFHTYETHWDEDLSTVLPGDVVEQAVVAEKLFPDKRKIIHFMQPHIPFINHDFEVEELESYNSFRDIGSLRDIKDPFRLARKGKIPRSEIEKAYLANIEVLTPYINKLEEELSGSIVITADHGNFLGENGLYGHIHESNSAPIRKVPWDCINRN